MFGTCGGAVPTVSDLVGMVSPRPRPAWRFPRPYHHLRPLRESDGQQDNVDLLIFMYLHLPVDNPTSYG